MAQSKAEALTDWLAATGAVRLAIGGAAMLGGYGWLAALLAGLRVTPTLANFGAFMVATFPLVAGLPRLLEGPKQDADADDKMRLRGPAVLASMTPAMLILLWSLGIHGVWHPATANDFRAVVGATVLTFLGGDLLRPRRGCEARGRRSNDIGAVRRNRTLTLD